MSFGVKGGTSASKYFVDALKLVSNMTKWVLGKPLIPSHSGANMDLVFSVGDCKTMATHPWSSTHSIMTEQDRHNAGITEVLLTAFNFTVSMVSSELTIWVVIGSHPLVNRDRGF